MESTPIAENVPQRRELLHVSEAAGELGVSDATVRRHIAAGELRALRLGEHGRYRVLRRDLDAFLRPVKREA